MPNGSVMDGYDGTYDRDTRIVIPANDVGEVPRHLPPLAPRFYVPEGAVAAYDVLVAMKANQNSRYAGAASGTVPPGHVMIRSDFLNTLMREYEGIAVRFGGWRTFDTLVEYVQVGIENA